MSAPKAGRQSPEPEDQSGKQQQDVPASGKIGEHASDKPKGESEQALSDLESNPKGPLEDAAQEKLSKGGRGDVA